MSSKRKTSSKKKSTASKRVAKKVATDVVKKLERKPPRPKAARTRAGLSGYGFKASFDHQWAVPIPASIGNVTESSRKRVTVVYDRTELVSAVMGNPTTTPVVVAFYINPRRASMFPWVSGQALGYETYRFKKLQFRYQPKCGTDQPGTVTSGIDYDASDSAIASEQALMTIPGSKQANVYIGFTIDALAGGRSDFAKFLFLSENATSDVTRNLGKFYFMCNGTTAAATVNVGEIYVDYVLELSIAQADTAGVLRGRAMGILSEGTTTVAHALSDVPTIMSTSSDFASVWPNVNNPITLYYPGRYFVVHWMSTTGTITYGSGSCTYTALNNGSVTFVKEHGTGTTNGFTEFGTLTVVGLDVDLNIAMSPLVTSFTGTGNFHLLILPCSLDFNPTLSVEDTLKKELVVNTKRLLALEARLGKRSSTEMKKHVIVDDEQCSFVED